MDISSDAVAQNYKAVQERITGAVQKHNCSPPRLVAVSKTKPPELIRAVHSCGQMVFGENYVQELLDKSKELKDLEDKIKWHFIGHLQSNKIKKLLKEVPNLDTIETVDSEKQAKILSDEAGALQRSLNVFIQVNTSGEESKSGVEPSAVTSLGQYIVSNCPNLKLSGLMTIGMPDYTSKPENFACLRECRSQLCNDLNLQEGSMELSMGMSGDFEAAIGMGSTNVRIGSTIFGSR